MLRGFFLRTVLTLRRCLCLHSPENAEPAAVCMAANEKPNFLDHRIIPLFSPQAWRHDKMKPFTSKSIDWGTFFGSRILAQGQFQKLPSSHTCRILIQAPKSGSSEGPFPTHKDAETDQGESVRVAPNYAQTLKQLSLNGFDVEEQRVENTSDGPIQALPDAYEHELRMVLFNYNDSLVECATIAAVPCRAAIAIIVWLASEAGPSPYCFEQNALALLKRLIYEA